MWCIHKQNVFSFKHYFASKSYATVYEAFSNAYPDEEVLNTTLHQLGIKLQGTCSVCNRKYVWYQTVLTDEMPHWDCWFQHERAMTHAVLCYFTV
jgi:hypothetical protein